MHKLIDFAPKNGNDSINFIGSFDNYGMSNILDILPLAAGLLLILEKQRWRCWL